MRKIAKPRLSVKDILRIKNGYLLKDKRFKKEDLYIDRQCGTIVLKKSSVEEELDLKGLFLSPGLIDLQLNGASGVDFSTHPKGLREASAFLPDVGVTAFLPTVITLPLQRYPVILKEYGEELDAGEFSGAEPLGIHLEGPFFNKDKRGAHSRDSVQPRFELSKGLGHYFGPLEKVRMATVAPEIEGGLDLVSSLVQAGIPVSLGHTRASKECALEAKRRGASLVTHLFNAMPSFHHREYSLIGLSLLSDNFYYSVIADENHLFDDALLMAWRLNPGKLFLVSDASALLGAKGEMATLGGEPILMKEGVPVRGDGCLASGSLGLADAVRRFWRATGCSREEALLAASEKPARIIGEWPRRGSLEPGSFADVAIFDESLNLKGCFVKGREKIQSPW